MEVHKIVPSTITCLFNMAFYCIYWTELWEMSWVVILKVQTPSKDAGERNVDKSVHCQSISMRCSGVYNFIDYTRGFMFEKSLFYEVLIT